jgi:FtsP/CotA-like multicopper oxidase with cupredoxin domain
VKPKAIPILIQLILSGVLLLPAAAQAGQIREYWIAAKKVEWNYVPSGKNLVMPEMGLGVWGKKTVYTKYRYLQYTDASYSKEVPQPEWMGILGPQLQAEVGDTFKVHFKNMADKPLSMHPHGVRYDEDNDGAGHRGAGAMIAPGASYTYTWVVDGDAGPGPSDPSSIVWVYHSHVDSVTEIYDGLIGSIVITRKGMARSRKDPSPKDVDRSFTTLFMIFNEQDGEEAGMLHAINGYIFGNLRGLTAYEGETVRWHLICMGNEVDLHTAHWHGKTVLAGGRRTDVIELLPSTMISATMQADNPGDWMFHCHVSDHMTAGMKTHWQIKPRTDR